MAKTIVGVVSSAKTDKTIVVTVHTRKTHPLYRKQYTVTSKFMAHDEKNQAKPGDRVVIVETRPISRRKRFALQEVLEAATLTSDALAATKDETQSQVRASKSKAVALDEAETEEAA